MCLRLAFLGCLIMGCSAAIEEPEVCVAARTTCADRSYVVIERDGVVQSACFEAVAVVDAPAPSSYELPITISAEAGSSPLDAGLCDVAIALAGIEFQPGSGSFVSTVEEWRMSMPNAWIAVVNAPCAVEIDVASTVLAGTWTIESVGESEADEFRARADGVEVRWDDGRTAGLPCAVYRGHVRVRDPRPIDP